jgi:hypothetical protein
MGWRLNHELNMIVKTRQSTNTTLSSPASYVLDLPLSNCWLYVKAQREWPGRLHMWWLPHSLLHD